MFFSGLMVCVPRRLLVCVSQDGVGGFCSSVGRIMICVPRLCNSVFDRVMVCVSQWCNGLCSSVV